ncbi:MAG: TonB-dependent receptor, partial [Sphingobacteriales bacterium]
MHPFRILVLLILLLPAAVCSYGQKKVTLSGYIRDAASGEALIAANVYIRELQQGAQTNYYGFYSVSAPQGIYHVVFTYVGYENIEQEMNLVESRTFDAELQPKGKLQEVEVRSTRDDENVKTTEMGTVSLSMDKIRTLPVIFGEVDVLKALQLMPGVQSSGEGNSGFYVRGGGPDQNLVLLDDAVVYNPGHLFGFFSVFNSDAVKNITLIKGSMPANYGGRLSSVVDVSMKEGNNKEFHAAGGIGLIASRLTIEGPIEKHKGSFVLSGRRTYIDLLVKPFAKGTNFEGSGYYFYDANLKANFAFNKKDRLYLSGYFGRDKFTFKSSVSSFNADIPWGNSTATLRWNHLFSDRLFMNASVIYNDYNFSFGGSQSDFELKLSSGIRDYSSKVDFDYYSSFNHHFKAGVNYTYHKFIPNQISGRTGDTELKPNNDLIKYGHEAGVYLLDDFDLAPWLRVNAGIRYSLFAQTGPYKRYFYDLNDIKTDSSYYGGGTVVKSYGGPEPRINLRFQLNSKSSIKASAVKSYQYIHLITNNGSTLPTDLWVPSTFRVRPQEAVQYSLGYFRNFLDNVVEG